MKYLPQRDMEMHDGQTSIPEEKQRRYRKPWVYKSDYDHLAFKYSLLKWATLAIVVGLLFVIKFG